LLKRNRVLYKKVKTFAIASKGGSAFLACSLAWGKLRVARKFLFSPGIQTKLVYLEEKVHFGLIFPGLMMAF